MRDWLALKPHFIILAMVPVELIAAIVVGHPPFIRELWDTHKAHATWNTYAVDRAIARAVEFGQSGSKTCSFLRSPPIRPSPLVFEKTSESPPVIFNATCVFRLSSR